MSEFELRIRADFMRDRRVSRLAEGPCFADAIAMFLDACSHSAREAQDGIVTRGEAIRMGWHREAASELVRVGLWGHIDDGFEIVDWPEYFPRSACTKMRRAADASRKARQRDRDREGKERVTNDLSTPSTEDAAEPSNERISATVSAHAVSASVTESPRDSVTFDWLDDAPEAEPTPESIGSEAGMQFAIKDLNLKKENNSSTPPPQSIGFVAAQTIQTSAVRNHIRQHRRPAARRVACSDDLWLPFRDDVSATPKVESALNVAAKPEVDDLSAIRGARLIFEATTMQHSALTLKNRKSCSWLASRPESEWELAKPVLLAEANKPGVKQMLTPQHIETYWPTHYSVGVAPRGRAALERERATLKPLRSWVGPSDVPSEAEYEAERAAARAGTLGALC